MSEKEVGTPKIVCLCGSTRFKEEFNKANAELTMRGFIVLSVGVFGHADNIKLEELEKSALDKLHMCKISIADSILVINVNGYIGSSTEKEIKFAKTLDKKVEYLEGIGGGV